MRPSAGCARSPRRRPRSSCGPAAPRRHASWSPTASRRSPRPTRRCSAARWCPWASGHWRTRRCRSVTTARAAGARASARSWWRPWTRIRALPGRDDLPESAALDLLCAAEQARLDHTEAAALWADTAAAWAAIDRPLPAAYARWREAEALLSVRVGAESIGALRSVHTTAQLLGAVRLVEEIETLARWYRVDLLPEVQETVGRGRRQPGARGVRPHRPRAGGAGGAGRRARRTRRSPTRCSSA